MMLTLPKATSSPNSSRAPEMYRPLQVSAQEIRVLDILPYTSRQNENLQCSLRHISLDSEPKSPYETISYCWGDPNPCETILVDGHDFKVPKNTYLALRRSSCPDRTRAVWIDAVCINQNDLQERSQQVNMMGAIYSQTTLGLIYLGEGDRESAEVFASLEGIAKEAKASRTREELRELTLPEQKPWATSARELRTHFSNDAMVALFDCPWFRRLWILQEAVLPSHSVCFYGDSQTSLDTLLDATTWMSHHFPYIGIRLQLSKGREGARRVWDLRTTKVRTGVFAPLMANTRETLTSDPRDRVFGLLGMATMPDRIPRLLRSDYTKSVSEVIRDGARYCIEVEQYPFIWKTLSHRCEHELRDAEWPSWVPRMNRPWSDTEDPVPFPHHEELVQPQDASVSGAEIEELRGADVLRIEGVTLDTIAKITDVLCVMPQTTESLRASLQAVLGLIDKDPADDFALHRTLTADLDYRRQRSDARHSQADFQAYVGWTLGLHEAEITYDRLNPDSEDVAMRSMRYYTALDAACPNRKFCVGKSGRYGLVPQVCQNGDVIALMRVSRTPVALRLSSQGQYNLLGECYLDGFMWPDDAERVKTEAKEKVIFAIR